MDIIEVIGYFGSIAAASCSLPQLVKMFRTKQVRDVSIWCGWLLLFAAICWIVYGAFNDLMPVIACNVVIFIQAILLVSLKMKWEKK